MADGVDVGAIRNMMMPLRIIAINEHGVTLSRLPVTPEEEAMVRRALQAPIFREEPEAGTNEQQQTVYPSGYSVDCAARSRVHGRKDSVQSGIPVEQEPV